MREHHRGWSAGPRTPALNRPSAGGDLAPRFPALDTLRAVGAFAVLTTHTMFWSGDYLGNGWLGTLWARLDVGVAIFFVLSGFLLSRPWFARREHDLPPPATGRYFWKRFLRIYPPYAVTVVISLALLTENRGSGLRDWVASLAMVDVYVDDQLPAGLTQMWSLATEVAFYLLLPLLMLLLVGRGHRAWRPVTVVVGLVGSCAFSVWWLLEGGWQSALVASAMPLQWLPSYLPWFWIGIGLALVHVLATRPQPPAATRHTLGLLEAMAASPGACWVAALGTLLVASTPLAGPALLASPTPAELLTKILLYGVVAGLLIVPAIFAPASSRYVTLMSSPPLRHLGFVSYSLFCVHLPVLHFVMWWRDLELFGGHGLQIWALTVVLSLAAAEALYWTVERPAQRLRDVRRPSLDRQVKAPATHITVR